MSLMINPVANVSFRAQESIPQNVEDILSRPGAFARPEPVVNQPVKKNNHTFLKITAGVLIAAGIIAGGLHYLPKKFPAIFKVTENISKLEGGIIKKAQAYITTGIAKGGEHVDKWAEAASEFTSKYLNRIKNIFKGKENA